MTDSPSSSPQREKKKRKQVRRACTNCRKAHSGCNEQRPCSRCIKNGLEESCMDVPRKPRAAHKKRKSQEKDDADDFAPNRPVAQVKKRVRRLRHSFDDSTDRGEDADSLHDTYPDFHSNEHELLPEEGRVADTPLLDSQRQAAESFGYINENVNELQRHGVPRQNLQPQVKRRKPKNREHYQSMVSELYDLQRYNSQLENTLQGILLEIHQMSKDDTCIPPPPPGTTAWTHTTSTSQLYSYPPPSPIASSASFAAASSSPLLSSSYTSTASTTPAVIANLKQDPLLSSAMSSYSPASPSPPHPNITGPPRLPPAPHMSTNSVEPVASATTTVPLPHHTSRPPTIRQHHPQQQQQQQQQPPPPPQPPQHRTFHHTSLQDHQHFHRHEPTIPRGGSSRPSSSRGPDAGAGSDQMRHPVY